MRYKRRVWILVSTFGLIAAAAVGVWTFADKIFEYQMPKEAVKFAELKPASAAAVTDHQGRVFFYQYGDTLHFYRPLGEISKTLVDYVVMLEDAKFFMHEGFDIDEIKNSIEKNMEKGKVRRGASTITQQLAKNLFLDRQRSYVRKLFEVPWTMRLEKDLTKKQILELYMNVIEWGPGIHGAEAAARHFFDKRASDLDIGNAMYLALIIPNPPRFDLFAHPGMKKFLEEKKRWLVQRLVGEKKIPASEEATYLAMDFGLVPPDEPSRTFPVSHSASYFGRRGSQKKDPTLSLIEKNLGSIRKKGRSLTLTLDKDLLTAMSAAAEVEGEGADRFVLAYEGDVVRGFRRVSAGTTLDMTGLQQWVDWGYRFEDAESVPWKSLAQ